MGAVCIPQEAFIAALRMGGGIAFNAIGHGHPDAKATQYKNGFN